MPEKNPLEAVLAELTKLLDKVEDEVNKPQASSKLDPDIEKMVADLEREVDAYQLAFLHTLEKADIDEAGIKRKIMHAPEEFALKDRRFLDRIEKVKNDLERKRLALRPLVKEAKKKTLTTKQKKRKRKKKFRGLGTRDKWRKL